MGLKSINNAIVPSRFLCITAHLVILTSILIRRTDYVVSCDPASYPDKDNLDAQCIVALTLSIFLLLIELISFLLGISLFNRLQLIISVLFHAAGAIALSMFTIYQQCSLNLWPIFASCSFVPLFTEFICICGICAFKRTVN